MVDSPPAADVRDLYERYGRAIYRRCQMLFGNDEEARDAFHDVFVKVVEHHDSFRAEASPLTWLVRIATNHCLNRLRARRAGWHDRFAQAAAVGEATREPEALRHERVALVLRILGKLERAVQLAAIFYFVDEMSQQEAAAAVGCSVPTLRKHLRRFVKVARGELKLVDPDLLREGLEADFLFQSRPADVSDR